MIPSERNRDEVRYEIRMKMLRSSGISFETSLCNDSSIIRSTRKSSITRSNLKNGKVQINHTNAYK